MPVKMGMLMRFVVPPVVNVVAVICGLAFGINVMAEFTVVSAGVVATVEFTTKVALVNCKNPVLVTVKLVVRPETSSVAFVLTVILVLLTRLPEPVSASVPAFTMVEPP